MSGRIFSELSTIVLALGMAFLVWIAAVNQEDPLLTRNIQPDIPLRVTPHAAGLIILDEEVIPDVVQVKIRAPQSIWQTLTTNKIKASVDFSTYSAGAHAVPVDVELLESHAVFVESIPSVITVQFEALEAKLVPVSVRIVDEPPLGYFNRLPVSDPVSVTVKGSATAVNRVEQVLGEIRIDAGKETIEDEITLTPLDADGNTVQDLVLEPAKSLVTVPIEQRFGYKEVSVKARLVGQPALGYWISSISVDPATVTLVGGPAVLQNVSGFIDTFDVDIFGATEDVIKRVPLDLPPGSSMVTDEDQSSENDRSVLVTVGISALTGGRTMQIGVTAQGVNQVLSADISPETVEVILSGPLPVLQQLNQDDITVIVDLFGLPPGTYRLALEVVSPDEVEVTSLIPDTVEVILSSVASRATSTPTPTPDKTPITTLTPLPSLAPTDDVTATNTVLSGTLIVPSATLTSSAEFSPSIEQD